MLLLMLLGLAIGTFRAFQGHHPAHSHLLCSSHPPRDPTLPTARAAFISPADGRGHGHCHGERDPEVTSCVPRPRMVSARLSNLSGEILTLPLPTYEH